VQVVQLNSFYVPKFIEKLIVVSDLFPSFSLDDRNHIYGVSYLERNNHCLENLNGEALTTVNVHDSFYFVVFVLCFQIFEISMTRREREKERERRKEREKERSEKCIALYL